MIAVESMPPPAILDRSEFEEPPQEEDEKMEEPAASPAKSPQTETFFQ